MKEWPTSATVKDLQWYLGFANFYCLFIQGFCSIASLLTTLLKKGSKRLKWTSEANQALQHLKKTHLPQPLCSSIQTLPNPSSWKWTCWTQASMRCSHRDPSPNSISFLTSLRSSSLLNATMAWETEFMAVKLALEEWRHLLKGAIHPFTIFTDHKSLEYWEPPNA